MKKRSLILIGVLALIFTSCAVGKIVNSATTSPIVPGTPQPQNSVSYALPKTELHVVVEIEKTTIKAGPFCNYAYRYLNIKEVTTVDATSYKLKSINVISKGVADPSKQFAVVAKGEASAQYITLSDDGVLLAVNKNGSLNQTTESNPSIQHTDNELTFDSIPLLEKHLKATSEAMMAEATANHIYKLRKRQLKLTGFEYDHHPSDAATLKLTLDKLHDEEMEFTQLFTGKQVTKSESHIIVITPEKRMEDKNLLFKMSEKEGLLDATSDLGEPIYYSYQLTDKANIQDFNQQSINSDAGLFYTKPAEVEIQLSNDTASIYTQRFQIAQLGRLATLSSEIMSNPNTIIELDPTTGALLKIGKISK